MPQRTIPEGMDAIPTPDGVTIRRIWRTWVIAPMAVFAVAWDGFLVFWYANVFTKPAPAMAIWFPLLHVAVGVALTYYVIAAFVNRTDVVLSTAGIRVWSGPAPWFGNKEVRAMDFTDVLVRERSNRGAKTYSVMYADSSRKERTLVSWLPHLEQAEYIAQSIKERFASSLRAA